MTAVHQLREALELRFPEAMPIARGLAPAVATGVGALDAALPNRGLPRGCLTVWRGGAGATALLRSACVTTVARGERAAWVDGLGSTIGDFWPRGVMMVRPARDCGGGGGGGRGGTRGGGAAAPLDSMLNTSLNSGRRVVRALSAAEELLRSGGFSLVVVTGVPGGMEAELVRLSRVAREGGGALVAVTSGGGGGTRGGGGVAAARLRVETWHRPEAHQWRRGAFGEPVEVVSVGVGARVTGTGWQKHVNLQLPVWHHAYRLSLDPGLVDRRGVRAGLVPGVQESVQPTVQSGGDDALESVVGAGLAGAGAAGGVAAGGGAAAEDRGARPDLGGRAWPGRAPVRGAAALAAG